MFEGTYTALVTTVSRRRGRRSRPLRTLHFETSGGRHRRHVRAEARDGVRHAHARRAREVISISIEEAAAASR